MLPVPDVRAAVEWYRDMLGFTAEPLWGDPPSHGAAHRNRVGIQFTSAPAAYRPQDYPGWSYVWVTDADALFVEFSQRGVTVLQPPRDETHGMREFAIADLNGYRLRFGQYLL